jgi:hypothetical protein
MTPCPKPAKPKRDRSYMELVSMLPCVCCQRYAVQVHHCIHGRFAQRKSADTETIPLCHQHHAELHAFPRDWRANYGEDTAYIEPTRRAVERLKSRIIGGRS